MTYEDHYDKLLLSAMRLQWITEELHEIGQHAGEQARLRGDDRDQASATFQILAVPEPLHPGNHVAQIIREGFEERFGPLDDDDE